MMVIVTTCKFGHVEEM